jgi:hypothetical protein
LGNTTGDSRAAAKASDSERRRFAPLQVEGDGAAHFHLMSRRHGRAKPFARSPARVFRVA